jgi:hypothetical protein
MWIYDTHESFFIVSFHKKDVFEGACQKVQLGHTTQMTLAAGRDMVLCSPHGRRCQLVVSIAKSMPHQVFTWTETCIADGRMLQ